MAYADYTYYLSVYRGKEISEEDYPRLSARACAYLDSISVSATHPEEDVVKMASCAVAEAWQRNEEGGEVVSQSVGSWSRTFATSGRTKSGALLEAARMYLEPAGLMRAVNWA